MKLNRVQIWFLYIYCLSKAIAVNLRNNYDVTQVAVINDPGELVVPSLRMVGRARALNGTFKFLEDIDDDVTISLKVYSDSNRNGEYVDLPIQLPELGACETLQRYYTRFIKKTFRTDVHTNFQLMDGNVCPLPKGTYWIKNVIFESDEWLNVLPYGDIKVLLTFMKDNNNLGALSIIINIASKVFK